jgi:hypothetical protein
MSDRRSTLPRMSRPDPRTRRELFAALDATLAASRSPLLSGQPSLQALAQVVERFRALASLVDQLDDDKLRLEAELRATRAALAFAQRASWPR